MTSCTVRIHLIPTCPFTGPLRREFLDADAAAAFAAEVRRSGVSHLTGWPEPFSGGVTVVEIPAAQISMVEVVDERAAFAHFATGFRELDQRTRLLLDRNR